MTCKLFGLWFYDSFEDKFNFKIPDFDIIKYFMQKRISIALYYVSNMIRGIILQII